MGKVGWSAIIVFFGAVAADQYFNYGYYTDAGLQVLRQIQHAFGW
jgi:hypothetical protein